MGAAIRRCFLPRRGLLTGVCLLWPAWPGFELVDVEGGCRSRQWPIGIVRREPRRGLAQARWASHSDPLDARFPDPDTPLEPRNFNRSYDLWGR